MIYATLEAAQPAADMLNRRHGFPPAWVRTMRLGYWLVGAGSQSDAGGR
jgi:hypothetical protein